MCGIVGFTGTQQAAPALSHTFIHSPFFVSIQSYYTNTLAPASAKAFISYSTVTLFAKFLGLSTSNPLATLT